MAGVSVALVNDYPVVVRGVDAMLQPYAHRVRVAGLGVQRPPDQQVDVTLYDTFASPSLLAEDVDRLLADPQSGRVLLYSWNVAPADVESALARGCAGYVDKAASAAELVRAIELTAAGEAPVVPAPAPALVEQAAPGWPGQEAGLSAREAEVLALIAQGLTNPEVAARLNLSINTVKTYVRSTYLKIGVARRAQAVKWGIEHGMLPGRPETA